MDFGSEGATCFTVFSEEMNRLPLEVWEPKRFGMACIHEQTFADWRSVIEKICSEPNVRCRPVYKDTIKAVKSIEKKILAARGESG